LLQNPKTPTNYVLYFLNAKNNIEIKKKQRVQR